MGCLLGCSKPPGDAGNDPGVFQPCLHHPHDTRLHDRCVAGEYIITARAKGLSSARILWRHAFGNISVPLVTVMALAYAGLLEGAVITETVFSWPGLGLI